jgi:hypothetical protein
LLLSVAAALLPALTDASVPAVGISEVLPTREVDTGGLRVFLPRLLQGQYRKSSWSWRSVEIGKTDSFSNFDTGPVKAISMIEHRASAINFDKTPFAAADTLITFNGTGAPWRIRVAEFSA